MTARLTAFVFALAALSAPAAAVAQQADPRAARAEAFIARSLDRLDVVPGVAVGVVVGDEIVLLTGRGVEDVRTGAPVDADTRFYIASATKPITALALAAMAGRGELDLDAPAATWAGDLLPAEIASRISLRDLLSHRAGVENGPLTFRLAYSGDHDDPTRRRLLGVTRADPETPRGQFRYSNVGYNLATGLLEAERGLDWRDMVGREVLTPLGMASTSATVTPDGAVGHLGHLPGGPAPSPLQKADATMHSAGGLMSSARDMTAFLEVQLTDGMLDGRRVLPESLIASTHVMLVEKAETFGPYRREGYALGWRVGRFGDDLLLHHFGNFGGSRAHVSFMPERGIGVVVLINEDAVAGGFADILANYLYDVWRDVPDVDATYDAQIDALATRIEGLRPRITADLEARRARPWLMSRPLEDLAGVYENPDMGRMEIVVREGEVTVRIAVLSAVAEAFNQPDSLRVELIPLQGQVITFDGPNRLTYDGAEFVRVAR
ncbi:serine hydrolase domain-containing protein [Brevundimonas sp.]|jgi:CubicO group peptidase (beta-lactamase class C family)|uniref:serine hydrolase domain-containing protein n=1 Tax=Brevundimonas sp. TaxID=1871086 RepID=UPI002E123AF1|nr:serine hydrolase domain-containing protein [Brevundimonas sp.]